MSRKVPESYYRGMFFGAILMLALLFLETILLNAWASINYTINNSEEEKDLMATGIEPAYYGRGSFSVGASCTVNAKMFENTYNQSFDGECGRFGTYDVLVHDNGTHLEYDVVLRDVAVNITAVNTDFLQMLAKSECKTYIEGGATVRQCFGKDYILELKERVVTSG